MRCIAHDESHIGNSKSNSAPLITHVYTRLNVCMCMAIRQRPINRFEFDFSPLPSSFSFSFYNLQSDFSLSLSRSFLFLFLILFIRRRRQQRFLFFIIGTVRMLFSLLFVYCLHTTEREVESEREKKTFYFRDTISLYV